MRVHDCTKCIHANKMEDHVWECDAENYDLKEFTCFVPKEEDNMTKVYTGTPVGRN